MPKGWSSPGTAYMIRDVMKLLGSAYVKQIHNRCVEFCRPFRTPEGTELRPGYIPPSYKSIQNMIYTLRKLGLVELDKEAKDPANPHRFPKRYYRVVPGTEGDPAWRNPIDAYYYPDKFASQTEFRITNLTSTDWLDRIRRLQR